ncbi:MAG: T9SS type A sorting domain-containing protein [Ignavibacteria bacterium]|nr:T9SS type A sorting domain-containing protein [Ignavibacteria bacterium]
MSAYLLDSSGGSGGEAGDIRENGDDIKIRDDFDKDRFNEDQRNSIKQSIINVLQSTKKDQDDEVIILKQKETEGDKEAGQKLKIKQALNDAVKVKRPRDESEYVKFVENDIKKVFGVGETRNDPSNNSSNIPRVFKLSQNYPNPFNPVTKINYDLPKDSKINIVIYDILGREVKRLVNNELKTAGSYIVDFNASNYASGVYFYRIEAEEPNGNKFVDSKKMVLLK